MAGVMTSNRLAAVLLWDTPRILHTVVFQLYIQEVGDSEDMYPTQRLARTEHFDFVKHDQETVDHHSGGRNGGCLSTMPSVVTS